MSNITTTPTETIRSVSRRVELPLEIKVLFINFNDSVTYYDDLNSIYFRDYDAWASRMDSLFESHPEIYATYMKDYYTGL